MPDERESPSAGWREVYDEMDADPGVEEATHPCPDCGQWCENVLLDVYECSDHGVFRASAGDESGKSDAEDASRTESDIGDETRDESDGEDAPDENYESEHRARGPAD